MNHHAIEKGNAKPSNNTSLIPCQNKKHLSSFSLQNDLDWCLLCTKQMFSGEMYDIHAETGSSHNTLLEVLNTLICEEKFDDISPISQSFSGNLCKLCKEYLCNLDRLQQKVSRLKSKIVKIL